ncbi:MAG: hypothetical protein IJY01_04020 [Clostridia bacterium]|nr:hypothetical protein [Clostridia bacterium]
MKKIGLKGILLILLVCVVSLSFGIAAIASADGSDTPKEIEVYLIAGQSNAVGYGEVANLTDTDSRFTNGFPNVLYYGEHEHWDNDDQKPPLEFGPTRTGLGQSPTRSGAEIGIAKALGDGNKMNAIIKCAWGGTSIYNSTAENSLKHGTWTSPTYIRDHAISTEGNKYGRLYTWFLETVQRGLDMLEDDGYKPVIKGIWWMQGEAETGSATPANAYNELLTDLINDMRADLTSITGVDQSSLPFVMGEITRNPSSTQPEYLSTVCKAQTDVAAALKNVFVVDTTGLAQQDGWHYTADAQITIGQRFVTTVQNASGDIPTAYGVVPKEYADATAYPLATFKDGKYLASYSTWYDALAAVNGLIKGKAKNEAQAEIVLIGDFTASNDIKGKFDNTSQLGGTLVIDLNGHTLVAGSQDHLLNGFGKIYTAGKMCDTNIIIQNGNLVAKTKALTSFGVWSVNYLAEKKFSYTFNKVNFSFAEGATVSVLISASANNSNVDTDATKIMYVDMVFNDCTFDLQNNVPSGATLFHMAESKKNIVQNVTVNGGKIIKPTLSAGSLYTLGSNDSIKYGKSGGHYTQLELPEGVTPAASTYASANSNELGALTFVKYSVDSTNAKDVYELNCLTTKYGIIPETYASIADYPFMLFKFNGTSLDGVEGYKYAIGLGSSTTYGAYHYAKAYMQGNEWNSTTGYDGQKSAVILQRRDYTTENSEQYENYAQARGLITFDLGGFTLSQSKTSKKPIFRISSKEWNTSSWISGNHSPIFPTTFTVKNGNIETFSNAVLSLQMSAASTAGYQVKDKIFTINFEEVDFSLAEGATASTMFLEYSDCRTSENDPDAYANFFLNFNDCTVDLTKTVPKKDFLLFNLAPVENKPVRATVTVNGGTVKSKFWDGFIKVAGDSTFGSTLSFGKYNGNYTALELPATEEYPSYFNILNSVSGKQLTFTLTKTEGITKSYLLGESEYTKYAYIPHRFVDRTVYPFIVIAYNGDGSVALTDGYKRLLGANNGVFNAAKDAISTNAWSSSTGYEGQMYAVILQRADYTLGSNEYYHNFAQIKGSVTYDLSGFTLRQTSTNEANKLFAISSKPWVTVFPSTITFKDGTILTYNGPIFTLGMWTGTSTESIVNKKFYLNLENVTLGLCEGGTTDNLLVTYDTSKIESIWQGKEEDAPYFMNLTDCTIDISTNAPSGNITLFNINISAEETQYMSNNITVNGGKILANTTEGLTVVTEATNNSCFTFGRTEGGRYTTITLPKGTLPPADEYNGLVFVKISSDGVSDTYRLTPKAVAELNFIPRTSITLESSLVFNVYIPENTYLTEFTLDGKAYTVSELTADEGYYTFAIRLPASVACRDIALSASFTVDGDTYTASYTLSTLRYAEKLLASSTSTAEKALICDMLAYVKSAYAYFGTEGAKEIASAIDALIGDGATKFEKVDGAGVAMTDGEGVTFILDAEPKIRFYFAQGTDLTKYSFKIGGVAQEYTETTETIGESTFVCADISLFAYKMIGTVEVYNDGVSLGSFHMNDYHAFALTQNNSALVEVVERFYMYCKSAGAYRDEVIAGE